MKQFKRALIMFGLMTLLTGIIYPLFITLISQLVMKDQANGSLIRRQDKIIGSALIAQEQKGDKYFWARPSAVDYQPIPSGASNLGPTSQKLKEAIAERKKIIGEGAPAEMLYASGSGLDPHISVETAYFQAERIAKARSWEAEKVKKVVDQNVIERQLFILGFPHVNVLILNLALDEYGQ